MTTKVKKWGNSFGVRIPLHILKEARIINGSDVEIIFNNNKIEIIPITNSEFSLDSLLDSITEVNVHSEILSSNPLGN